MKRIGLVPDEVDIFLFFRASTDGRTRDGNGGRNARETYEKLSFQALI